MTTRFQQAVECFLNEVESLLPGQAGNHADDRGVGRGVKMEILPERLLAMFFTGEVGNAEVTGKIGIGVRVPDRVINTVQDAEDAVSPLVQDTVQSEALLRSHNLGSITGADGSNSVGENDAALEKVDIVIELQATVIEKTPIEVEERPGGISETTLVSQVMNGHHGFDIRQCGVAEGLGFEKDDRQSGMPVMGMEYMVGLKAHQFQDSTGKKDKAFGVVRIILICRSVEAIPIEIAVSPEQI